MKIVYLGIHQKIWIAAMDGHGEFPDLHPDLSQNLCWWMILNTGWILNSSNWYWTDTESIISVLYYINVYFLKCQRSFYHAFLKFRFNKPWPGPRIRTSRQSELGLALWVLLNVCVGPTLRWKALLEGNGCAKQHSVYSCLFSVACVFCVFCSLFLSDQNYGCISTLEVGIANLLARKYP